jgi:hypothetical protein
MQPGCSHEDHHSHGWHGSARAPFGSQIAADIAALHEINGVELICDAAIDSYYSGEGVVSELRRPRLDPLPAAGSA